VPRPLAWPQWTFSGTDQARVSARLVVCLAASRRCRHSNTGAHLAVCSVEAAQDDNGGTYQRRLAWYMDQYKQLQWSRERQKRIWG